MTPTNIPAPRQPEKTLRPGFRVVSSNRQNAKAWARTFEARMLEPGIVSYEDAGCGKAFLTKESIERSMPSFVGRPLILTPRLRHKKVSPADLEKEARGYITDWYYNSSDGWFWVKGICHDDDAKDAINRVGFCSCAYEVTRTGTGGEYHAIPYDEEIQEFSGEHLAIVDRPRYEGATIRLNSKPKHAMSLLKWFRKPASRSNAPEAQPTAPAASAAPAATTTPAAIDATRANSTAEDISADTELEIPTRENGKTETVTLATLIESHQDRQNGLGADDTLEVDGHPVKVSEILAGYRANAAAVKTNAEEDKKEEDKKENAEEEKPDETKKENAAPVAAPKVSHFRVLPTARANGRVDAPKTSPDDLSTRCNRGTSRYGKAGNN